jgi:hypothetical protein
MFSLVLRNACNNEPDYMALYQGDSMFPSHGCANPKSHLQSSVGGYCAQRLMCSPKTLVKMNQITQHQIPGKSNLNSHICDNVRYLLLVPHEKATLQNTALYYRNLASCLPYASVSRHRRLYSSVTTVRTSDLIGTVS